jgi:ribonuclease BN (tRNA processing enzyme)
MAELLILGSGTGTPNARRSAPGYLLIVEGKYILLDSGPGTLQRLISYDVTYQDIDYVVYTHFHPDHTLDLPAILFAARNSMNPRRRDLTIIGPRGLTDFYNRLLSLYPTAILPQSYKVVLREMDETGLDLEVCKIRAKTVAHAKESLGFRVETRDGASLAYSGDTDYCENMVKLAKDADLLILECSAPDGYKMEGHLNPSMAGRIASLAHAKRLVLSHFYPICDRHPVLKQAKKTYRKRILLAKDGMKLKF